MESLMKKKMLVLCVVGMSCVSSCFGADGAWSVFEYNTDAKRAASNSCDELFSYVMTLPCKSYNNIYDPLFFSKVTQNVAKHHPGVECPTGCSLCNVGTVSGLMTNCACVDHPEYYSLLCDACLRAIHDASTVSRRASSSSPKNVSVSVHQAVLYSVVTDPLSSCLGENNSSCAPVGGSASLSSPKSVEPVAHSTSEASQVSATAKPLFSVAKKSSKVVGFIDNPLFSVAKKSSKVFGFTDNPLFSVGHK
jgi:hypothetical protein